MLIYIDMDDVLCDFTEAYKNALRINPGIEFPQSQYGFFQKLVPIKDSIQSVKILIDSDKYDPYILTAPSTRNPFSYLEKRVWIEEYFGYDFTKKLILCSNKALLKGDILIDDNISGRGQENFEGRLIHFGSSEYPNWKSIQIELGLT